MSSTAGGEPRVETRVVNAMKNVSAWRVQKSKFRFMVGSFG